MTWGRVRPRFEREIEDRKTALVSMEIDKVPALQAEIKALMLVCEWFEAEAPEDRRIFEYDHSY